MVVSEYPAIEALRLGGNSHQGINQDILDYLASLVDLSKGVAR